MKEAHISVDDKIALKHDLKNKCIDDQALIISCVSVVVSVLVSTQP